MGEPSETEQVALGEAGPLLRFAAERVKDLDPNLSLAIAKARAAADGNSWTPDISQYFWAAFSKLCDLIQPVTMDCLAAGNRNIEPCMFNRWRGVGKISLAERSSSRYLATLFVLILVILPLQLYVWTCTNLSKKIDDTYGANKSIIVKNAETFRKVAASTSGADHNYTQDELTVIDQLSADESTIRANLDRASYEASLLRRISTLSFGSANTLSPPTISNNWYEQYTSTLDRQNSQQVSALKTQEESDLVASILLSFIMPILFGAIGAVAYVIRTVSDQINTSTFSINTPIRHLMRVGLGALAGVVVGLFNGLSTQLSLPPLAIAFLAGYGVEALFSMFDGIVAKFRQ